MDNLIISEIERSKTASFIYYSYTREYPCTEEYQDGEDEDGNPIMKQRPAIDNRVFEATTSFNIPDITKKEALLAIQTKLESEMVS